MFCSVYRGRCWFLFLSILILVFPILVFAESPMIDAARKFKGKCEQKLTESARIECINCTLRCLATSLEDGTDCEVKWGGNPPRNELKLKACLRRAEETFPTCLSRCVEKPEDLPKTSEEGLSPPVRFYLGKAAYDLGQYHNALRTLRPLAESGHAGAQFYLGIMIVEGRGTVQDETEGVNWYARAAEQGHADAQYYLGVLYGKGVGVSQDFSKSVRWWQRAADQGQKDAQYSIGHLYFKGWMGLSKDYIKAYKWISLAASAGHEEAIMNRRLLKAIMSDDDLSSAKSLANVWKHKKETNE